ncbi:MAG TPA: hypothetical protein VE713_20190 [Pyrinomonadaceae bacterium]|jgi:hypothetical protein|nr:hypothetical protein [Pyrinomonadaceae bacterium]
MKKSKLLLCVLALSVAAAVAVSIRAQKQSGATAPKDAAAHPDCPLMSDGRQHPDCPLKGGDKTPGGDESSTASHPAGGHDAHLAAVNTRGEKAMGFSQTETTHHFILNADGGVIQVEAGDPNDAQNRAAIRQHLARVALMFAAGDFGTPLLVHGRVPPGVPVMRRLKSEINYVYEETERGARVRITTKNAEALAAVRDFLRFQITEHQTGDPLEVK